MRKYTVSQFFYNSVIDKNGCWIWKGGKNQDGYASTRLDGKSMGGHRRSYHHYFGPIPKGLLVLHKCDNPPCINPHHLFLGTQDDNMKDAARKGRASRVARFTGEDHPNSTFTEKMVLEIRRLHASGMKQRDIARKIGAGFPQVNKIIKRTIWRNI